MISQTLELTNSAIRKWRSNGIPDRYWAGLIKLSNDQVSEVDLYRANELARKEKNAA